MNRSLKSKPRSAIFDLILPFLIYFCVLRIVFWGNSFPNPDEAYYWLWGQNIDWSYYDHPPLHAWIQGFFTTVFGRSTWVLRLPNFLSNTILLFTYWRISCYLYGDRLVEYSERFSIVSILCRSHAG